MRVLTRFVTLSLAIALTSTLAFGSAEKRKPRPTARGVTRVELREAEARLAEMGYDTGRIDGVIDDETRRGLVAFQKWELRKVTGRITRDELEAIMNATAPQPKESDYRHVEVDIDRQVLLLVDDDGSLKRILPVSTGSDKRYKEKRMSGLAYTARGRFRIYSKIAGWRESPLGLLYYPNYFSGGLAIHGNPSVPHQPESHGCIRIPMSAAVEMSKQMPIGTIVLVYDQRGFVSARDWAEADRLQSKN